MEKKIKIREASIEDAKTLDEMLTRLIRHEANYDKNLNDQSVVKDNYKERIGVEGHKIFVAEEEGRIIGFLYGFVYGIPDMWKEPIAILDALFVDEQYRGKGCARMLFEEFRKFACRSGVCRIELKVISENADALRLYQKLEFVETKKYMSLVL